MKGKAGFGSHRKNDERYAYIHQSQSIRMKSPGTYINIDGQRKRQSHNQKNVFISEEKRFCEALDHTIKNKDGPGPGAYIDKDLDEPFAGSLLRNLTSMETIHGNHTTDSANS